MFFGFGIFEMYREGVGATAFPRQILFVKTIIVLECFAPETYDATDCPPGTLCPGRQLKLSKAKNKDNMTEAIVLQMPEKLARQVKQIAALNHRPLEDILVEWIDRALSEIPVESLPDEQVLALCDLQLEGEQQEQMSELLARNREGQLDDVQARQLDELMQVYRRGLVRKAKALKVAVERGLKTPIEG